MIFHEYLTTPKTTEQLVNVAKEHGVSWNADQVELYVLLDPSIFFQTDSGQWTIKVDDRRHIILEAIEKALGNHPLTKIDPNINEQLPNDMIVPQDEVIEVAVSTGRYESPRGNFIRVKRN